MRRRLLRPLDRYVLGEFVRIFAATALGFPMIVIVFDLTEKLEKYLARQLAPKQIALAYLAGVPDTMFLVLPAAVLFATVFAIGGFTRHSEITAAKASGISFHRFIAPIAIGAAIATMLGLLLTVVMPFTNATRERLLDERKFSNATMRYNFTYAAEEGRVYTITSADVDRKALEGVHIQRRGTGPAFPTMTTIARTARYTRRRGWTLREGVVHVLPGDSSNVSIQFDSLRDRQFREEPIQLMSAEKPPLDMGFNELGRFIAAMERSGSDANTLRVERMLKLAIPVTCIIIMLFGAPLATSTQRGGTAYGVAVSLGTTIIFLMLVQLTKAIGGKGLLTPELAAWLPGIVFGVIGTVMLSRVRT
ncbi:MAG: LptF/LptG family permease [Gemmatimonadaceae bacterium]|nr:LptF/LptG family permease [Gemmatimonadaceae bacterium]